jgi:hypothetical protein
MENHKILKFKNGEIMVCRTESKDVNVDNVYFINVWDPVTIVIMHMMPTNEGVVGERYLLKPWMPLSEDEMFIIDTESLITICNVGEQTLKNYLDFQNRRILNFDASEMQESPTIEEEEESENDIIQELLRVNEFKRVLH